MITGKLHKTRFKEIGFTMSEPGRWRFVDITDAQDGNKDHMHEIGTAYPTKEQLILNIERYAAEYGCEGAENVTPSKESDFRKALETIASLWPDPGMCGPLVPEWVGPNDGRMRADTLWYALNTAREALGKPVYPRPTHRGKKQIGAEDPSPTLADELEHLDGFAPRP